MCVKLLNRSQNELPVCDGKKDGLHSNYKYLMNLNSLKSLYLDVARKFLLASQ